MTKENVFNLAQKFGFIRYKGGIDWSSNYDNELVNLVESLLKEALEQPTQLPSGNFYVL
jgi:hypothetical protein